MVLRRVGSLVGDACLGKQVQLVDVYLGSMQEETRQDSFGGKHNDVERQRAKERSNRSSDFAHRQMAGTL